MLRSVIPRWASTRALTTTAETSISKKLAVGDCISGYRVQETRNVADLELTAIRLQHLKTGATHFHVARQDPNCVFSVAFKTAPMDSTGVPHILEHTTLCGSAKYPVRDPFFKMLNRSMATYMNAWTASDWTMYPLSAVNATDLENLRSVYMDATFHPLLQETDFRQEGWRLEHEKVLDASSPITFKGIVYNEMKGAFSDVGSLFQTRLQQHLHAGTTYGVVSGGDPPAITDLSYAQLVNFHKEHYHPSNAMFFTYGDYPLEKHLEYIDSIIGKFDKIHPPEAVMRPQDMPKPLRISESCPSDPMGNPERQTKMSVAFRLNDTKETYETFVGRLMSYLLMQGHASPMYKALIESNLGSEYSPASGYDDGTQISTFSIGLQGMRDEDAETVEQKIQQVFEEAAEHGFEQSRIEGAIHQIELGVLTRSSNFGLGLTQGLVSSWAHSGDPLNNLEITKTIAKLRADLAQDSQFFQKRVRKYFLENDNKLVFVMKPDAKYNQRLVDEEAARLRSKVEKLSAKERTKIFNDGKVLAELQDNVQDISCLPCLKLEDVSRKAKDLPLEFLSVNSYPVQWRTSKTNGITYFRALAQLDDLPEHLRPFLPLYTSCLTSLGTKRKSAAEFDEEIVRFTGGIGASLVLSPYHSDICAIQQGVTFSGSCLDRNLEKMYQLLEEAISETNFGDLQKLKTLVLQSSSGLMNSLADSGHMYARKLAASNLTISQSYSEIYGGLSQAEMMSALSLQDNFASLSDKLVEISDFVRSNGKVRAAVTLSKGERNEHRLSNFLTRSGFAPQLSQNDADIFKKVAFDAKYGHKVWVKSPFATNFAARCTRASSYSDSDSAALTLLSSIMTHKFLHREIREKNGAYGGGASFSAMDGIFSFYSYRDPNPAATLDTFRKSSVWATEQNFDEQTLTEAKLSLLGKMDAPLSAAAEGMSFFETRITRDMKQKYRDTVFGTSAQDISRVAQQYLVDRDAAMNQAVIAAEQTQMPTGSDWSVRKITS